MQNMIFDQILKKKKRGKTFFVQFLGQLGNLNMNWLLDIWGVLIWLSETMIFVYKNNIIFWRVKLKYLQEKQQNFCNLN